MGEKLSPIFHSLHFPCQIEPLSWKFEIHIIQNQGLGQTCSFDIFKKIQLKKTEEKHTEVVSDKKN